MFSKQNDVRKLNAHRLTWLIHRSEESLTGFLLWSVVGYRQVQKVHDHDRFIGFNRISHENIRGKRAAEPVCACVCATQPVVREGRNFGCCCVQP